MGDIQIMKKRVYVLWDKVVFCTDSKVASITWLKWIPTPPWVWFDYKGGQIYEEYKVISHAGRLV